ncbi:MAG: alpha-amylase family glycosyl hydrolase [Spirochaetia bacterium]|nr:alpha-amylase family glycosyl hydrolase [Spirochaetota bacterium]MDW8112426.1 alpha-amylase family glycosyl hydrolase [Spirochaetia bacterium]
MRSFNLMVLTLSTILILILSVVSCNTAQVSQQNNSSQQQTGQTNNITNTNNNNNNQGSSGHHDVNNIPVVLSVPTIEYTTVTTANFSSYPVSLAPYEAKVILISNLGSPGSVDTDPSWYLDAVVYQIFVRSFYDSNGDGNGDLNGVISKLDYITNIGFNAIWFLPIFESPSYHGYDATDYYSIESDYGNLTSFNNLLQQAHQKGVRIILDMVLNHTSSSHPWFINSANNGDKANWYVWTNVSLSSLSGWGYAWGGGSASNVWHWNPTRGMRYYGAFWDGMPDLNILNPAVSNELLKIGSNWLAKGVDGYRLDAVRYLIETGPGPGQRDTLPTKQFLQAYNNYMKTLKSNFYTVGEVWENNSIVSGYHNRLDTCFSFDFAYSVRQSIINQEPSSLVNMINTKPSSVPWKFFAPFLDNHDDVFFNHGRWADQFGGGWNEQYLSAVLLLTFPGTPYVYYGSEIGMKRRGTHSEDIDKRTPMHWDATSKGGFTTGTPWTQLANNINPYNVAYQLNDPNSLLNHYKKLINIRRFFPSLRRGDFKLLSTSDSQVMAYMRIGTNESILVVANFSSSPKSINVNLSGSGLTISSTYNAYVFLLGNTDTNNSSSWIQMDGYKESIWNNCKIAGSVTNTTTETKGWDFGGFLGLYVTNDQTNIYIAFETVNVAGGYGNTLYIAIDSPTTNLNSRSFTNTNVLTTWLAKNVVLTNNLFYDLFIHMYAPPNGYFHFTNAYVVWANGSYYYITNSAVGGLLSANSSTKFVEISLPLSYLSLNLNDQIKIFAFFSGDNYPATAYCAIPFNNANNSTTGGTSGPLPNPNYNSLTILDDYATYTIK